MKKDKISTKIYQPNEENVYARDFNYYFVRKYLSFKKLLNLSRGILAQSRRAVKVSHLPYVVYIDPTNICPLRCPLCPTGLRKQGREVGMISLTVCQKIVDQLKDYLFFVRLYNWGEPFLNPEIFKMIDYIHQSKIGTVISTNLNFINNGIASDDLLEKIVRSPLDYLLVSMDGVNQTSYEQYRQGGDFSKVINSLKKLVALKKRLHNNNLKIEWLFIVNRYNQAEMEKAKTLSPELGVDVLHFSPIIDSLSASRMDDSGKKVYQEFKTNYECVSVPPATCSWLYSRLVFNWDGKVSPCCALDNKNTDFGDANQEEIKDIWNSQIYQTARKIFHDQLQAEQPNFICSHCLFMK